MEIPFVVFGLQILLHSMHKYFLRLVVEEEHRPAPGEKKGPPKPILSTDFPETTFIAVTAYQNEEVGLRVRGTVYAVKLLPYMKQRIMSS